ncbi:MAG TPA: AEC family transporter [Actinomycetaceae bacterium]|nr:AEC family transporter [Actinomycetaceae bacterium]
MLDTLSAIVPIFLIVAVGYGVTRAGVLKREDMTPLSTYVVKVALPVLIFVNVSGRPLGEILNATYLLIYAVAAMAMVGLIQLWVRARGVPPLRGATLSLAASGTNNGFVGFPIFLLLLPGVVGPAISMDMIVDNVLIIPLGLVLFEAAAGEEMHWRRRLLGIVQRVLLHPLMVAIVLALLVTTFEISLPGMLDSALSLVANSSSAVALFAIGGMLVGLNLGGQHADLAVGVTAKLLVMPAVAVGLALLLPMLGLPELDPDLRAAAILTCALPSMSIVPAIGEQYGEGEFGAATQMLSTLLSGLTISGWLLGLAAVGWL